MIPHFEKMLYDNGRCARHSTPKRRWRPEIRCSNASPMKPARGCCARCKTPLPMERGEVSTPPTTRTPKVTKASSTCGRAPKCARRSRPSNTACSAGASAWTKNRISKAHGTRMYSCPSSRSGRSFPSNLQRSRSTWTAHVPSCSRSAQNACGRVSTTPVLTSWNALAIRGLAIAARCSTGRSSPRPRNGRSTCAHASVAPVVDGRGGCSPPRRMAWHT